MKCVPGTIKGILSHLILHYAEGIFFFPYCLREIESGLVFRISRGDAEPFWASISLLILYLPSCLHHVRSTAVLKKPSVQSTVTEEE